MVDRDALMEGFRRLRAQQHGQPTTDPANVVRRWVVGRDPSCDVVVDDPYASPRHCEVALLADGTYRARDLGSTNGTWLRVLAGGEVKVYGWTPWVVGQALVVGRSSIPRLVEGGG